MKKILLLVSISFLLNITLSLANPAGIKADDEAEGTFNYGKYIQYSGEKYMDEDGAVEVSGNSAVPGAGKNNGREPIIDAHSAIVIDKETKRVLFAKDAYSRRNIASTTKDIHT